MFIKQIDLFGVSFEFKTFDRDKYKTVHGGLLTTLACVLIGTVIYLFGKDFFYKQNPKIFSKQEIPLVPKIIAPTNQNFSIMWKVEDDSTAFVSPDKAVFHPFLEYFKYSRTESNSWQIEKLLYPKPKKCSETSNKDNPQLENLGLDVWHCIDWEELSGELGEPAKYGGQWDSTEPVFVLRMSFNTCPFNYSTSEFESNNCSTVEDVSNSLSKGNQYFSFNLPDYSFDTTDYENPIKQSYTYLFFKASTRIVFSQLAYFTQEAVSDDRGWVLEDKTVREAISFKETTNVNRFISDADFAQNKNQTYFSVTFYFDKSEKIHFRSYIKAQELFANIGGIFKLITMCFGFVSELISREMLEINLINSVRGNNQSEAVNVVQNRASMAVNVNNSLTAIRKKENLVNVSFCRLIGYRLCWLFPNLRQQIEKKRKEVLNCIDVAKILDTQRKNSEPRHGR